MFAATAAGIHSKVEDAMAAMGSGFDAEYSPDANKVFIYAKRYSQYSDLAGFVEHQVSFDNYRNQNQQTASSPALSGVLNHG